MPVGTIALEIHQKSDSKRALGSCSWGNFLVALQQMSDNELQTPSSPLASFVKIEARADCYRFYRLALWPDLFGGWSLVREWGRLGQEGTLRLRSFATEAEAEAAMREECRRRVRRGYREATA